MARIEDYALIGDMSTTALVSHDGSVDWWCIPDIDSPACFAALLGGPEHGRWRLRPTAEVLATRRRYVGDSLVLETEFETAEGTVAVLDFMLPGEEHPAIYRIVEGRSGSVEMRLDLTVRFDYGSVVPWVRRTGDGLTMVAGADGLRFHSAVPLRGEDHSTTAAFTIAAGESHSFSMAWYSSLEPPPLPVTAHAALNVTLDWWTAWLQSCTYQGPWRDVVVRSLITLKALTFARTGAVVAAPTTSLPEEIGGVRNWDYRYSWLRDASFTLQAFLLTGLTAEARAWSEWLRRAVAGSPGDFQIMYDVHGRRRLTEQVLDWLPGYEGSAPVRIGNGAYDQVQLDVFGEVIDAALTAVEGGLVGVQRREHDIVPAALAHLDTIWQEPDAGIWEIRGPLRHFTHSKVMAWVAYDRAVRLAERLGLDVPLVAAWRASRDAIHAQVCERGWSEKRNSFVQYYDSEELDASLLVLARVGFLPADDPRIVATVEAIERELVVDGLVRRYATDRSDVDGVAGGEGVFLLTSFWLVDNLALIGRHHDAVAMFERLLALRNDVGLLAEEYDPVAGRMLGNFPQAFSHLATITTAIALAASAQTGDGARTDLRG